MPRFFMIDDEDFARDQLLGPRAFLDSFRSSVSLAKVEHPKEIEKWFDNIQVVPSFLTFQHSGRGGYYRTTGCQEMIPTPKLPGMPKASLHVAVGKYDFAVDILDEKELDDHPYYKVYAGISCFGQACEGHVLPKGNQVFNVEGWQHFRLFHHTSKAGKESILEDNFLEASTWNFCGTRHLKERFCYLTDLYNVQVQFDTLPLLIRNSPAHDIVLRTDDNSSVVKAGVEIGNRTLNDRVSFVVDFGLIQPNPMVFHQPLEGQPKWLEVMFPYIYRIPCDGIYLKQSIEIEGEKHWVINKASVKDFRDKGFSLWASGNDKSALWHLINETPIP